MRIKIDLIKIGNRFRKDCGDIEGLAASIKELGQLQPIGVDANYNLVFGERRIMACKALSRDTIEGNIFHLDSILKGEFAENAFREQPKPSEMVALAAAIEEELKGRERRGRPSKENVGNCPQFESKKSREIAAEKAGFSSTDNYGI